MHKRRLLFVSSNHLALSPGGLESYTSELYDAFRRSDDVEPIFLARAGSPAIESAGHHGGSPWEMVGADTRQYLFYTDLFGSHWDDLFGRWTNKQLLTRFFRDCLLALKPDVVHFQHLGRLGYEAIRVTRDTLPNAPIVYTIHEYLPICHRNGQMVRTVGEELCDRESPRRCHECFPEIAPQQFFARKRFVQSQLALVDRFIAPSEYVRDRYVNWGLPAERMLVEPQGVAAVTDRVPDQPEKRSRDRFAYFGQLTPFKGADVLLEAFEILGDDFGGHLTIFGANLERQSAEFQSRVEALLGEDDSRVTFAGPYKRSELGKLMATIDWVVVPSIWWETGPMVVVEAFQYGRPVICSNIGGMSEKVTHNVNGLHFRRRDSHHLAQTLRRAAETPGLWDNLRAGIPPDPGRSMEDHVETLRALYEELLAEAKDVRSRAHDPSRA